MSLDDKKRLLKVAVGLLIVATCVTVIVCQIESVECLRSINWEMTVANLPTDSIWKP